MSKKNLKKLTSPVDIAVFLIVGIIMLVYGISLIFPIINTINTSLKDPYDYIMDPGGIASVSGLSNYKEALQKLEVKVFNKELGVEYSYGVVAMLLYSFIISGVTAFMAVFLPSLTAYAVARYRFRGRNLLYQVAIVTMIIPIVGNLSSALAVRKALGIYNNLFPYLLTCGSGFGFNFVLLYGAFKGLSPAYGEAAMMDGAGHFTRMFVIYYPMLFSLFLSMFVLAFVGSWNDYMTTVVYLPDFPNLAYGIYYFQENAALFGISEPVKQAGFIIIAIPTTIIWAFSQKLIMSKMTVGGLKG